MSKEETKPGDNVLSIVANRPTTPAPELDKIERYWNLTRSNRLVPSRCEIDPRGLEGVLGNAFILERITGGLARFRIAGSHIADLTGLELRQMPISALFMPASREILSDAMTAAFDDPCTVRMKIESKGSFGRQRMVGEMILLPLRSDLGQIDRILGGIVLDGKIGRTPRRLEILGQSRQSLVGYAGPAHRNDPAPQVAPKAPATPPTRVHAPLETANKEKPRPKSERGYLKLVVDNA